MFIDKYRILFITFLGFAYVGDFVAASAGDRSQFFINCVQGCKTKNCTKDGLEFSQNSAPQQDYFNQLLLWSCADECNYMCMWRTTVAFLNRKWHVPQFYGKWPFKRMLGIQEPASVAFSLLNFAAHYAMIKRFRRDVRSDSPMYYVWHVFCGVCLNGWVWSTVFHCRDYPLTELFDYGFAYSIVLASCCCMLLRMIHNQSNYLKISLTVLSIFYFFNHFALLSVGNFDYSYNMKANVITGIISGIGWLAWYFLQRKRKPYAWKMLCFQLLAAASLLLELNDFPPILWTLDAHSLWHLATVPLTGLFYSFIIDDCRKLRQEKYDQPDVEKEKLL